MDAARFSSLVRRWWWLSPLGALMAIAAYGVAMNLRDEGPAQYRATGVIVVSLRDGERAPVERASETDIVDRPWDLDRLMATYAEIIRSDAVAERAAIERGDSSLAAEMQEAISVATPGYTQLIEITARGNSPAEAERIVGATLWALGAVREEREVPGVISVLSVSDAEASTADETPVVLALLIVGLAGAVGAAALVLVFESLSGTLRDTRDAEAATGVRVLASMAAGAPRGIAMGDASGAAERYRMLRTAFGIETGDRPATVVLCTAPSDARDAATVAANFALAAAHGVGHGARRVALVDADLRAPALHEMFGVSPDTGLVEALHGDLALDTTAMPAIPGVALIVAGGTPENPSELLDSDRFDRLLLDLRERFDLILLNSPAALAVTDAAILAARADASIVVLRADRTLRSDATACVETLRRAGSRVLGAVLLDDPYVRTPGVSRRFFRAMTTPAEAQAEAQ